MGAAGSRCAGANPQGGFETLAAQAPQPPEGPFDERAAAPVVDEGALRPSRNHPRRALRPPVVECAAAPVVEEGALRPSRNHPRRGTDPATAYFLGTFSSSASQAVGGASEGIRQSPRGDMVPPALTFGPLGSAERLNWLAKNRLMNTSSHRRTVARS